MSQFRVRLIGLIAISRKWQKYLPFPSNHEGGRRKQMGRIWHGSAHKIVRVRSGLARLTRSCPTGKKKTEETERAHFLLFLPVLLLENFNRHTTFFLTLFTALQPLDLFKKKFVETSSKYCCALLVVTVCLWRSSLLHSVHLESIGAGSLIDQICHDPI